MLHLLRHLRGFAAPERKRSRVGPLIALHEAGVLDRYGCPLIGADVRAIQLGEDRQLFKGVVERCGAESARSVICHTMDECLAAADELSYPVVVRPSFTMGGLGSGFAAAGGVKG